MAIVNPYEDLPVECLAITMSNDNPWNGPYPTPVPSEFIRFFYEPCSDYPPNGSGFTIDLTPQATSSFTAYAFNFGYEDTWSTNFTITTQSFTADRPLNFQVSQSQNLPNVSQTKLPIALSSNETGNTEFKYLMDVYYSGSSDKLTRVKTKPNPEGYGIFEVGSIYDKYLDYEYYWTSSDFNEEELTGEFYKDFQLKFGTEFIPPGSSSVVVHDGYGDPGEPSYGGPFLGSLSGSNFTQSIFKGTVNPLDNNTFNFEGPTNLFNNNPPNPLLSNKKIGTTFYKPNELKKYISTNDFETLNFIYRPGGSLNVDFVDVDLYLLNGNSITDRIFDKTSGTDADNKIIYTVGVGPQNLISGSSTLAAAFTGSVDWEYYDVEVRVLQPGPDDTVTYRYYNINPDSSYTVLNSWSIGPVVPNTKFAGAAGGTRNDILYTNGFDGGISPSSILGKTFAYNGSSWSTKQTNPFPVERGGGAGNTSAFIAFGGDNNLGARQDRTTYFNGSSWSVVNSLQTALESMAYAGDASDALAIGGDPGTQNNKTQFWNGTNWSYGANLNNNHDDRPAAFGNSSKTVVVGDDHTEEYNGIAWSNISFPPGLTSLRNSGGSGTGTTGIIANGRSNISSTSQNAYTYNGTTFSAIANSIYGVEFNDVAGDSDKANSLGGATLGPNPRNYNQEWDTVRSTQVDTTGGACYDITRFAWINPYGVWEYYSIPFPITKTTNIKSKNTSISKVDYNNTTSPYDVNARTMKRVSTSFEDNFKITTNYLLTDEANFVKEMIDSPRVFIQDEVNFLPIVVTNSSYVNKTNLKGQKTFQYTIEFKYSNQRQTII